MQARELLDEVPDLNHTAARLRHLLIEPKTLGEITTSRLAVQSLEFYCIILNVGFRSGETFADELLREVAYYACQIPLTAASFAQVVRSHWGIEGAPQAQERKVRENGR